MAKRLTALSISKLKPNKNFNYDVPDAGQRGLKVRIYTTGNKAFRFHYRDRSGDKKRKFITYGDITLERARKLAAEDQDLLSRGIDPVEDRRRAEAKAAGADSVRAVFERYLQLGTAGLRTAANRRRTIERLVYPAIGHMPIGELRRGDIVRLLDKVAEDSGPVMADKALAFVRKALRWHCIRDDNFVSPIVPGMARIKPAERARSRVLEDDELVRVWKASEAGGPFAGLVRFLLLTAARRAEAADLTWSEVSGADWTLPRHRNKVNRDLVRPLSAAAQAVIAAQPRVAGCPYIFTTNGRKPLRGFAGLKAAFDKRCGIAVNWTLHDLRRTARSLMSRAGVNSDHAERCLGHVIGGVRGVYDRHEFYDEKRQAYEALAAQVGRIVNPRPNVVALRGRKRR